MTDKRKYFIPCCAIVASCWASGAQAQSLDDKVWVELGGYRPRIDSEVQVTSKATSRPGTVINLEQDLKLDKDKTLGQISAGLRLGGRWVLGADFYSLKRNGTTNVARDIVFDDVVYPATATVDSSFKSTIYRFTVGYAILRKPDTELGASLGAHVTDFDVSLSGIAQAGGATASSTVRRRQLLAPLPTIGIYGNQRIAKNVTIGARVDYLSLKVDDYHGRLINAQAAVTWRFVRNVGIGAMYRYVDYEVKADKTDWSGRLQYKFKGPAIFLQVGF